jgi:hypothetical protein
LSPLRTERRADEIVGTRTDLLRDGRLHDRTRTTDFGPIRIASDLHQGGNAFPQILAIGAIAIRYDEHRLDRSRSIQIIGGDNKLFDWSMD